MSIRRLFQWLSCGLLPFRGLNLSFSVGNNGTRNAKVSIN